MKILINILRITGILSLLAVVTLTVIRFNRAVMLDNHTIHYQGWSNVLQPRGFEMYSLLIAITLFTFVAIILLHLYNLYLRSYLQND